MLTLKGRKVSLRALAFSADGTKLAVGGDRAVVQVWNLKTKHVTREFALKGTSVYSLFWIDQRRLVAFVRWSALLTLDLDTRQAELIDLPSEHTHYREVAPSADRRSVCLGYRGLITRADLCAPAAWRWREPIVVAGPNGTAVSLAWSNDGRLMAAGLMNGQVKLYDAATGREAATFGEAGGPTVNAVALSPDGTAAVWGACTHLHFHRPGEGVSAHHALGKTHFLGIAWHPSGEFFATANGDGKVDYWDARAGQRRVSYDWGVGKLNAVVFDAAGDRAACCSDGGDIVIWDVDR